jgi:mTERF domain-containing protein
VLLLYELGLRTSDFDRLAESRPEIFQMGIVTMRRKLKFLQDTIGLSNAQLAKVISKFPRILEYRSERTLRPRLDFLARCGVSQDDLAKVFVKAPMVLELSVKDTLEPRAAFLRKTLRLPADSLGKLIVRHPQALTCTEDMMAQRVEFLLQQGLSQEEVGRAVLAHPQVLHYKIDSMRERVDYLHTVGLTQAQVAACAHRFPQLFSLDIAANLDPKWHYLTDYICASGADCVDTLCSYPGYFSLSLTNRVVPRHRFYLHTAPKRGASPDPAQLVFPMNALKCSDAQFVKLCGASLEEYEQFREVLLGGTQPPPSVHPSATQHEH